jgi:hypothetical protein
MSNLAWQNYGHILLLPLLVLGFAVQKIATFSAQMGQKPSIWLSNFGKLQCFLNLCFNNILNISGYFGALFKKPKPFFIAHNSHVKFALVLTK